MNIIPNKSIRSDYVQDNLLGLPEKFSLKVRKEMFESLMKTLNPTPTTKVLDVGVTCDQREDSNFFEKWYPYKSSITAVGMEDCRFLEKDFPGLRFVKVDGAKLPFEDNSFDLAVSFATIEHVGSRQKQKEFIRELCRVSRQCCITTPNRWHPIEFHSIVPLIHWLPPRLFRLVLSWIGKPFWAKEENLNLLSQKEIMDMLPADKRIKTVHFRFFGFVSNLMFYIYN